MRASCSPQSELRPGVVGLAPPYGLATHCPDHCNTSVAQGIKGPCGFDVIPSFLPAISPRIYSWNYGWAVVRDTCNTDQGLRSLPHLREHFKARADDNHAAPELTVLERRAT